MAERIDAMLREHPDRCHFYAIGTRHLLGEGGVLQRLRQKGYRITRLQPPPSTVAVLEQRIAELLAVVIRQAKANALLDARVRSLEFKVQVLERRLR
jgi:ABC-type hemin transport system substrate-binding protein